MSATPEEIQERPKEGGTRLRFQLVIDCRDPKLMTRFWTAALGYELEPPPAGFATWDDYWRTLRVPEEELDGGSDSITDPTGRGPRIWFQKVEETKTTKNRLHLDLRASGGRSHPLEPIEIRKQKVEAEAARFVALGATRIEVISDGTQLDHYAVAMSDPEGNEFDIN